MSGVPRWLVALPAWGSRCVGVLLERTVPALVAAFRHAGQPPARVTIWTDPEHTEEVASRMAGADVAVGWEVDILPVPGPDQSFESMSNCHRQLLDAAEPGDRVVLLTADMVVSREIIATCGQWLSAGKMLVCCVPPRALQDAQPPVGASGPELLDWVWTNRHPMTRECTWPEGRSYDVWRMYFERDGNVAARVFLPHPLACIPHGRKIIFKPTIDVNLTMNFSPSETYLITQPHEGAIAEVSPTDKDFLLTTTMRQRYDEGGPSVPIFARTQNPRHRMFFDKPVLIRGSAGASCGDEEVVRRVIG